MSFLSGFREKQRQAVEAIEKIPESISRGKSVVAKKVKEIKKEYKPEKIDLRTSPLTEEEITALAAKTAKGAVETAKKADPILNLKKGVDSLSSKLDSWWDEKVKEEQDMLIMEEQKKGRPLNRVDRAAFKTEQTGKGVGKFLIRELSSLGTGTLILGSKGFQHFSDNEETDRIMQESIDALYNVNKRVQKKFESKGATQALGNLGGALTFFGKIAGMTEKALLKRTMKNPAAATTAQKVSASIAADLTVFPALSAIEMASREDSDLGDWKKQVIADVVLGRVGDSIGVLAKKVAQKDIGINEKEATEIIKKAEKVSLRMKDNGATDSQIFDTFNALSGEKRLVSMKKEGDLGFTGERNTTSQKVYDFEKYAFQREARDLPIETPRKATVKAEELELSQEAKKYDSVEEMWKNLKKENIEYKMKDGEKTKIPSRTEYSIGNYKIFKSSKDSIYKGEIFVQDSKNNMIYKGKSLSAAKEKLFNAIKTSELIKSSKNIDEFINNYKNNKENYYIPDSVNKAVFTKSSYMNSGDIGYRISDHTKAIEFMNKKDFDRLNINDGFDIKSKYTTEKGSGVFDDKNVHSLEKTDNSPEYIKISDSLAMQVDDPSNILTTRTGKGYKQASKELMKYFKSKNIDSRFNFYNYKSPIEDFFDTNLSKAQLTEIYNKAKQPEMKTEKTEVKQKPETSEKNIGGEENPITYFPLKDEVKLLEEGIKGSDWISTRPIGKILSKKELVKQQKIMTKDEVARIKADEKKMREIQEAEKMFKNTRAPLLAKKEKAKTLGINYDFKPLEKEVITRSVLKKNLRSSKDIKNMIDDMQKKGVSKESIEDFRVMGHKLDDIEIIKKEENGVVSAVWTKEEVGEMVKNYRSKLSPKKIKEIKSGYTMDEGVMSGVKSLIHGLEEPQLFFERIGMKKIYDIARGGSGRVGGRRGEAIRLIDEGSRILPSFDALSKKEAQNVWKNVAIRQGYIDGEISLSKKEQAALDTFDAWKKETEAEFLEVAKMNGIDIDTVDGFFPMRTKDEYKRIQEGEEGWDRALKNYRSFSSLKKRNRDAPVKIFETDVRKVMSQYIHDHAEFVEMGKVLPQIKAFVESDTIKKAMGDSSGDYKILSNWFKDITSPETFTPEIGAIVKGADFLRKGASRAHITSLATGLKQFIPNFQTMIMEGVVPSYRYNDIIKDLPSIFERRGGDFVINDMGGKLDKVLFTIPRVSDSASARAMGGGLMTKELKKNGFTDFYEIPKHEQDIIINRIQDKIDFLYGGVTKEQLPPLYRKALGKHLFAFMRPTTSLVNYALKKGVDKGAVGYLEGATFLLTGAYFEQVITNLSFNWGSEDDMAKDIASSFVGNFPLISLFVYPFRTGRQVEVSTTSGVSNVIKKAYDFRNGNASWQDLSFATAEMFGLPTQIRRTMGGYDFIKEEGFRDKNDKLLAPMKSDMEALRALYKGEYAPLAVQEYLSNIGKKSEDRAWIHPEVEFLQNGDYARKVKIAEQLGDDDVNTLLGELSEGQRKEFEIWKEASENLTKEEYAERYPDRVYKTGDQEGEPYNDDWERYQNKIKLLNGEEVIKLRMSKKNLEKFKELDKSEQNQLLNKYVKEGTITHEEAMKIAEELKK